MKAKALASDPFVQLAIAAVAVAAPFVLERVFGVDVDRIFPKGVDATAAIPVLALVALIGVNAGRLFVSDRLRPRAFYAHSVEYDYVFRENGDFEGTITSEVENRSGKAIEQIPSESLLWNEELDEAEVYFEIVYKDGLQVHAFSDPGKTLLTDRLEIDRIRGKPVYGFLTWSPRIEPPLPRGGRVTYEVRVKTPGTETEAFTEAGTTLGFPVTIRSEKISLTARAPFGFGFRLMNPPFEIIDMATGLPIQIEGEEGPELIGGGTSLRWRVRRPEVGRRYWVHYRFFRRSQ